MKPVQKINKVFALALQEEQYQGIICSTQLPKFDFTGLTNNSDISTFSVTQTDKTSIRNTSI